MSLPSLYASYKKILNYLQPLVLLAIRICFGYQFMLTGYSKLMDVPTFAQRYAHWGVPFPTPNVYISATTECVGGALLLLGLGSRFVPLLLSFTMLVAYATAHKASVIGIFSPTPDPDTHQIDALTERFRNFFDQAAMPFLLASLTILAFGPGCISLDALLKKFCCKSCSEGPHIEQPKLTKN